MSVCDTSDLSPNLRSCDAPRLFGAPAAVAFLRKEPRRAGGASCLRPLVQLSAPQLPSVVSQAPRRSRGPRHVSRVPGVHRGRPRGEGERDVRDVRQLPSTARATDTVRASPTPSTRVGRRESEHAMPERIPSSTGKKCPTCGSVNVYQVPGGWIQRSRWDDGYSHLGACLTKSVHLLAVWHVDQIREDCNPGDPRCYLSPLRRVGMHQPIGSRVPAPARRIAWCAESRCG